METMARGRPVQTTGRSGERDSHPVITPDRPQDHRGERDHQELADQSRVKLAELLPRYFEARPEIRSDQARERYTRALRVMSEVLGHEPTVGDLSDSNLTRTGDWLAETRHKSTATRNGTVGALRGIFRWCHATGLTGEQPTIRLRDQERKPPESFTEAELAALFDAAQTMPGALCGMPKSRFWSTVLRLVLSTQAPIRQVLAYRWEWIDWTNGELHVPAEVRRGGDASYLLDKGTLLHLANVSRSEGLILNWTHNESFIGKCWSELAKAAGIEGGRDRQMILLRRTRARAVVLGITSNKGRADQ